MSQSKKSNAPPPDPDPPEAPPPKEPLAARLERSFRPGPLLALALLALGIFCWPIVVRHVPKLDRRPEYRVGREQVEIVAVPEWAPRDLVDQVFRGAGLPEEMSLLDDGLTARLAAAFARHPWVRRVVSVRKSLPARIAVDLEFRRPAAMIRLAVGAYPVDADGTLLPPEDFSAAQARRFPAVEGIVSLPQGPAGTAWGDPFVSGAAQLAAALEPHWERYRLAAIVVPRRTTADPAPDDVVLQLATDGGTRIVWGRSPRTNHPGELSVEQKIGRLDQYLREFGTFDGSHGPYEIDIRHWQEISRRPLTAVRERPRS